MRWGIACVLLFACGSVTKAKPDAALDAPADIALDAETVVVLSDPMGPTMALDSEVGRSLISVHVHSEQPNQNAHVAFSGTLGTFSPTLVAVTTDGSGDGSASAMYAAGSDGGAETVSMIAGLNGIESAPATAMFDITKVTIAGNGQPFTNQAGFSPNYLLGEPITVVNPGMLTKIGFVSTQNGPNMKVGIYTANGAVPGTLVAQMGPVAIQQGINEVVLATPVPLVAGTYWYEAVYDSVGEMGGDSSGVTTMVAYCTLPFTSALPTTFPAASTYNSNRFNYFVVLQ